MGIHGYRELQAVTGGYKGLQRITNFFLVGNRLFAIYFHGLLHGNTWGYRGLQGVTKGLTPLEKF